MKKIIISTFLIFAIKMSMAQTPNLINYQAVALNSAGSPIANASIKVRVKIHNGTSTGTVIYVEERSVNTDANGLFNFQIDGPGKIIGAGAIGTLDWVNGAKFLQIEIDPTNGSSFIDMGTQELVTVPFAKVADKFILPFSGTASNLKSFEISNTNATGSAIVGNVNNASATAITANGNIGTAIKANATPGSSFASVIEVTTNGTTGNGLYAIADNGTSQRAVYGHANVGTGIYGFSLSGTGVYGRSNTANAIFGEAFSTTGVGVYAKNSSGSALKVDGKAEFLNKSYFSDSVFINASTNITGTTNINGNTNLNGNLKIYGGSTNPSAGAVLTSDAAGNATWKANKVAFAAVNTTNISMPNSSSTWTTLGSLSSLFDASGNFNPSSASIDPNTFIVPVSGYYNLIGKFYGQYSSSIYNIHSLSCSFKINGVTNNQIGENFGVYAATGTSYSSVEMTRVLHLNAGDKVMLQGRQTNGGSAIISVSQVYFAASIISAD